MRLLIDTHALLWFIWDHTKLSTKARDLMADGNNDLLLSTATLWEIAIKISLGKLTLAEPYEIFMDSAVDAYDLSLLPITVKHASVLTDLPFHHRDPFDRLLVSQAIAEETPLVSGDATLDAYSIARVW
ncbi:MAG: type II toxin-antitoxin system VapC family toxin [bacterium]